MKKFTCEFDSSTTVQTLSGEICPPEKAHSGEQDYVEFNTNYNFASCEMKSVRDFQEDAMVTGLAPEDYFTYPVDERREMHEYFFPLMQEHLTKIVPGHILKIGSTGIVAIAKQSAEQFDIDLSFIGDSQAILVIQNTLSNHIVCEILNTELHHPTVPSEMQRIEQAGGKVVNGRVVGSIGGNRTASLALSRAFGNNALNNSYRNIILREPTFMTFSKKLAENEVAYLLVVCDGFLEGYTKKKTAENANDFVSGILQKLMNTSLTNLCSEAVKEAITKGSTDNVSLFILKLTPDMKGIFEALYDGHGGKEVAQAAQKNTSELLTRAYEEKMALTYMDSQPLVVEVSSSESITPTLPFECEEKNEDINQENEVSQRRPSFKKTPNFYKAPSSNSKEKADLSDEDKDKDEEPPFQIGKFKS